MSFSFDYDCKKCPRLYNFLKKKKIDFDNYHMLPVDSFGDLQGNLLIVGLAPGFHGANKTNRPFTGDYAGNILYETLYELKYTNSPNSKSQNDGLMIKNARITNAVRCCPPQNKPSSKEIKNCNGYLGEEINNIDKSNKYCILTLGRIAHEAVILALGLKRKDFIFKHGFFHEFKTNKYIVNSYHTSKYNVYTKRLTYEMFYNLMYEISKVINHVD